MNPITSFLVFVLLLAGLAVGYWVNPYLAFVFFAAAAIIALSLKMANVWQKFVILRMGKLQSVKGRGAVRHHPGPRHCDRGHRRTYPDHGL